MRSAPLTQVIESAAENFIFCFTDQIKIKSNLQKNPQNLLVFSAPLQDKISQKPEENIA